MDILLMTYQRAGVGGSFARACGLARGLMAGGHTATVVAAGSERGGGLRHSVQDGVPVVEAAGLLSARLRHAGLDPIDSLSRLGLKQRPAAIFALGHRPSVLFSAMHLAYRWQVPWVYDWSDLWNWEGIGGFRQGLERQILTPIDTWLEQAAARWANGCTAISRDLAARANRAGAKQVQVLAVGADLAAIAPLDREVARQHLGLPTAAPLVVHAGFPAHDLPLLQATCEALLAQHPTAQLVFTGQLPAEFVDIIQKAAPHRSHFLGLLAYANYAWALAAADVCLLPYSDLPINRARYPNKLGDYLAAARPVVTSSVGDLAELMADNTIGIHAPATGAAQAAAAMTLLNDPQQAQIMGNNGRQLAETRLNWAALASTLVEFFRTLGAKG